MLGKFLFGWLSNGILLLSGTMLLCLVTAYSTAGDEPPMMLSAAAFAKASAFIKNTGRPLERALFAFHVEHGSRDSVIAELAKFQNADGGFASFLESDNRWTGSSPMATMIGLRILNVVGAPAEDSHVQAAVRYLLASFDQKAGYWHAQPKEANAAPHAPWWEYKDAIGKCDVESPVFPTGAIAGYLRRYSGLVPKDFLARITKESLDYLLAAPVEMQMSDIEMLTELVRFVPENQKTEAVRKLRSVLATVVVRDPQQWSSYGIQPLSFIRTPDSPFYAGMEKEISVNLNYVVSKQEADGGWGLNWSWEKNDPAAWEIAKKEWRGVVTLENLEKLEAFHRIAH